MQLTFSLCFSSSILALLPLSFLLPLLCPTSILLLISLYSFLQEITPELASGLQRSYHQKIYSINCINCKLHSKKKTPQNLCAAHQPALVVYSLVTRKHLSLLFHPKKKKKQRGFGRNLRGLVEKSHFTKQPGIQGQLFVLFLILLVFSLLLFSFSCSLSHSLSWHDTNLPEHSITEPRMMDFKDLNLCSSVWREGFAHMVFSFALRGC